MATPTSVRSEQFQIGAGQQPVSQRCCAECGYASENNKHFRKGDQEGTHTCTTGHYEDDDGNLKRARNPYARH